MQYRRLYPLIGIVALVSGCANRYKTRLDCIDICKEKGLRYVDVVKADKLVNTNTGETKVYRYCQCE